MPYIKLDNVSLDRNHGSMKANHIHLAKKIIRTKENCLIYKSGNLSMPP